MKCHSNSDEGLRSARIVLGFLLAVTVARAQPCSPGSMTGEPSADARIPSFLTAWVAKYPTSTLPARMDALTGRTCNVCHSPPNLNTHGNCYRDDISALTGLGMAIEQALDQLDGEDSDGDGVSNGDEIRAARPEAGEVGYNPGLIGDFGTDPCGNDPDAPVTNMSETPASSVPAISDWGVVVLALSLLTAASLLLRRRKAGPLFVSTKTAGK